MITQITWKLWLEFGILIVVSFYIMAGLLFQGYDKTFRDIWIMQFRDPKLLMQLIVSILSKKSIFGIYATRCRVVSVLFLTRDENSST